MSHYGTTSDGYYGQRTMCGKTVTSTSMFVAALTPSLAHCGMKITIRYHGRKYHVRVQDRGAWRSDGRDLDAAPGLHQLIPTDLAHITYTKGWK